VHQCERFGDKEQDCQYAELASVLIADSFNVFISDETSFWMSGTAVNNSMFAAIWRLQFYWHVVKISGSTGMG
jgi:hypothetical protein